MKTAKKHWELHIQQKNFPDVYQTLKTNEKNPLKEQLGLKLDEDGFIRCHGRFINVELPDEVKYPKLLPRKHHLTDLIIESYHKKLLHAGTNHTLSQLRYEYWVPHGRTEVKRVLCKCTICRCHEGGPYKNAPNGTLVKVTSHEVITIYFHWTRLSWAFIHQREWKNPEDMGMLVTWLAVCAVHLELARNMSTEQFLLCFSRFIVRRGQPTKILWDNALQFKLAQSTLDKAWQRCLLDPKVLSYTASKGITWQFIVQLAAWMGSAYECLVGLVTRIL